MRVIYGIKGIKKFSKPVVALGVFDGVHLGHINILKAAAKKAHQIKGKSIVLTFWPHPQKQESLYSLEHRLNLIAKLGVDIAIVIEFDAVFSRISAQDFINNILIKKIGAHFVYVGKNFKFGQGAKGDYKLLKKISQVHNVKIRTFDIIKVGRRPVSSTYIRKAIKQGNLKLAQRLLTRQVSVLGTVIRGDSLARKLGFPTANIDPHHEVVPPQGVYAVNVIYKKNKFNGICSIGRKPTFIKGKKERHIEVYIFDFQNNLYGKDLEIRFIKKMRNQKKFNSTQALIKQIKKDIIYCQGFSPATNPYHNICL